MPNSLLPSPHGIPGAEPHSAPRPLPGSGGAGGSPKKKGFAKNWAKKRVGLPAVASTITLEEGADPYMDHLKVLLKQVTFRINMYKMSADYYQARDQAKYQTPIQLATVLGSLLSLAVPVMDTQSLEIAALASSFLNVFATSWTSQKNAEKLNVKSSLFRGAVYRYQLMARDLAKDMMKRKATYRNGAPKTLDVKDEDNMELAALLQERYQYIIETQEQLAFSPDKKLVKCWLNEGILTGERPKRIRRRRIMPETGKPPEPGEGYEEVAGGDFDSDNEEWDYEDAPSDSHDAIKREKAKEKAREKRASRASAEHPEGEAGGGEGEGGGEVGDAKSKVDVKALTTKMQSFLALVEKFRAKFERFLPKAADEKNNGSGDEETHLMEGGSEEGVAQGGGPPPVTNPLMAILNRFKERGEAKKAEMLAKLEEKKKELEKKRGEMEDKFHAKRNELQDELKKKETELRAKATAKGLEFKGQGLEALEKQKLALEKKHAKMEKGLNAAEENLEEDTWVFNPSDDPLMLHAEVLSGQSSSIGVDIDDNDDDDDDDDDLDEIDYLNNFRLLLVKTYYRQNMYSSSAQYCDAQDRKYLVPILLLTACSLITGFFISSPIGSKAPTTLAFIATFFNICSAHATRLRQKFDYQRKGELFRNAAINYRIINTSLEQKLRAFRCLPEESKAREKTMAHSKIFFADVGAKIKTTQMETNTRPFEGEVRNWLSARIIAPNEFDQPEDPPRELTLEEMLEATCIRTLDRAEAIRKKQDKLVATMDNGDGGGGDASNKPKTV